MPLGYFKYGSWTSRHHSKGILVITSERILDINKSKSQDSTIDYPDIISISLRKIGLSSDLVISLSSDDRYIRMPKKQIELAISLIEDERSKRRL